jgi:hypothetical protein
MGVSAGVGVGAEILDYLSLLGFLLRDQKVYAPDDYNTDNTFITTHVFLASLLGSI